MRKEKGIKMTAKELNLAARTVFAEAATEGLNGQMAVAQTMYDQLYHNIIGADGSGFGKTLEEVIQNAYTTPTEQDIRGSSCLRGCDSSLSWRDRGFLQIITCISLCQTEAAATGEITGIPIT